MEIIIDFVIIMILGSIVIVVIGYIMYFISKYSYWIFCTLDQIRFDTIRFFKGNLKKIVYTTLFHLRIKCHIKIPFLMKIEGNLFGYFNRYILFELATALYRDHPELLDEMPNGPEKQRILNHLKFWKEYPQFEKYVRN